MAYNNNRNYRNNRTNNSKNDIGGLSVEVRNGDVNKAIRIFKKKVQEDGILQELRERQFYEKPSIKRNKAKKAARNRHLKAQAKRLAQEGY